MNNFENRDPAGADRLSEFFDIFNYPRVWRAQKSRVREALLSILADAGYKAEVINNPSKSPLLIMTDNFNVITECEQPNFIITAHYDTTNQIFPRVWSALSRRLFSHNFYLGVLVFMLYGLVIIKSVDFLTGCLAKAPDDFEFIATLLKIALIGPLLKFNVRTVTLWDDNTSGIAAALCLAESLKKRGQYNVQFIFFDNEEKGRLGSKGFIEGIKDDPSYSGARVINLDSIGRGQRIYLVYDGTSGEIQTGEPELQLAREMLRTDQAELSVRFKSESDCKFFTQANIQALTLTRYDEVIFLGQKQQDLSWTHTHDDTRDRIDYEKIREVIRIVEKYLRGTETTTS